MNALTQLRDLLAEQDYQQAFAQQVARDLNLPRAQIKFSLMAATTWQSLLEVADAHDQIPALVTCAIDYFPASRHALNTALASYQQQTVPPVDTATMLANYRHWVQQQYGTMQVFGMSQPVPLGDIYTNVHVLDQPTASRRFNPEEQQARFRHSQRDHGQREKRQAGLSMVESTSRLFILGKPGAGKTTFLKHLAVQTAAGALLPGKLPIFISLKALADSGYPLLTFAARQLVGGGMVAAETWLERWLHDGTLLLLLDGLDEVNSRREGIIDEIEQVARRYSNCPVLLTCRIAAAEYTFEHFRYLEMADFAPEQVVAFVRSWFRDAATGLVGDNDSLAEAMLKELGQKEHEGIRELASSPLLLTLLCLAYQETLRFPARRVEIYEGALDALLKKWDISRRIRRNSTYGQLSLGRKRQMLAKIAYETFRAGHYFLPQRQLEDQLKAYLIHVPEMPEAVDIEPDKVLIDIIAQHGLFVEQAHQIFSFSHLTFQEYFAAKHIVDNASSGTLAELVCHATENRWREVFLLVSSLLPVGEPLFEQLLKVLVQPEMCSPKLITLLHQVNRATYYESLEKRKACAIRSSYLFLVQAGTLAHTQSFALDFTLTLNLHLTHVLLYVPDLIHSLALALDLPLALDLALALDLPLDLAFALSRALNLDLALDLNLDLGLTFALTRALDSALNHAHTYNFDFVLKQDEDLDLWLDIALIVFANAARAVAAYPIEIRQRIARASPILQEILAATAIMARRLRLHAVAAQLQYYLWPDASASDTDWKTFIAVLENILGQQRGFSLDWEFSRDQRQMLSNYLQCNLLFVECLGCAYVQDRAAVEDQILLPPSP